ncbi:MAG: hypothetical protein K8I00_07030, partial [Candidatus Omnitrophica bacterium]|nr:hypothetical protein [Candidatus Omnitrophota bacterium]
RLETFLDIDTNEGYRKFFYPAGGLQKSLTIKADTMMDYKEYDADGQLVTQQDGLFNGTLKTFYVDGTLMQEDRYQDGIAAGFTMYDLQGNVLMHSP